MEKYPSRWGDAGTFIAIVLIVCAIGVGQNPLPSNLVYPAIMAILIAIVAAVTAVLNTYLIIEGHTLINSGYRSFGKDKLDIRHIKYICRQSTFVWKSSGSTMVVYLTDDDGKLRYTALKEVNWKDEMLKRFLLKLLEIKSTIELDPEYKNFLDGKYDESGGLKRYHSSGTAQSINEFLKSRGEKLEEKNSFKKFLEKFL